MLTSGHELCVLLQQAQASGRQACTAQRLCRPALLRRQRPSRQTAPTRGHQGRLLSCRQPNFIFDGLLFCCYSLYDQQVLCTDEFGISSERGRALICIYRGWAQDADSALFRPLHCAASEGGSNPSQDVKADLQYSLLMTPLSRTEKLKAPGCFARLTL